MKATQLFFWSILYLFLYQNCGQEKTSNGNSTAPNPSVQSSELGVLDLTRTLLFRVEQIEITLQLNDGRIVETENPAWAGQCMRPSLLANISEQLTGNSLCESKNDQASGTFCAQIYTFPYLELFVGNDQSRTKVGESINACPEIMIHFCEDDDALEDIFRNLNFERDFETCPKN